MKRSNDRYGKDVLSSSKSSAAPSGTLPLLAADIGLIIEEPGGGFVGELVQIGKDSYTLEDAQGGRRLFDWLSPCAVEGRLVRLTPPKVVADETAARSIRSASGSVYLRSHPAQVAKASRILVEGKHDAELVEKVWGHDLRVEGVVVEMLDGVDNLPDAVKDFSPSRERRLGVLLDHLTLGSKESRIAAQVSGASVLVTGHPYIDIWQGIKPVTVGITQWPSVPRGLDWKSGVCDTLRWPSPGEAWQSILASVHSWHDLEPSLIGSVEALIDFVTAG